MLSFFLNKHQFHVTISLLFKLFSYLRNKCKKSYYTLWIQNMQAWYTNRSPHSNKCNLTIYSDLMTNF